MAGPGVPLNSPILNPGQALSGQSLYNAASALANAQTQGPLAELAKQIATNNQQTTGTLNLTGGYLKGLGSQAQQGVTDEQNIGSQLNANLGLIGGSEQQGLQGIAQNQQASLAKYSPQSDQSNSLLTPGMSALTTELARQQGLAAQQQGAFKSFGALQGANYGGLAAQSLGTDALAGTQALKGIAQAGTVKNEPLNSKVAALDAQRGALLGTDLGKLRQQEVANQFTAQGLGIKQQTVQTTAAQDQAKNALTARGQNITNANDLANQQIHWSQLNEKTANDAASQAAKQGALNLKAAAQGAKGAGAKPLTPNQTNAWFAKLGSLEALVHNGTAGGLNDTQIRQNLESGANPSKQRYDPVMVETAFQLLGYGSIDRSQAAILHGMGLRGGTFRGAPIRVTANYQPPGPNTAAGAVSSGITRGSG